ncbi:helix-turn-helix transcriptional regulator [Brachybacterium huguangmaarense]|uniref:helix-turn-helix transcriptional regulator n=1 Tax=Brachybacterium huguangmaarense TaxID=1652028 RepID=UPI002964A17A|nr:hypothetical protein [Brachybacterium huguangmaarense]
MKSEKHCPPMCLGRGFWRHRGVRRHAERGRCIDRCSARRINEIGHGERAITAGAALRLERYVRADPFWLDLQTRYELDAAEDRVAEHVGATTPLEVA